MRAHRPPHLLGQLLSSGIRVSFAVVLESKGLRLAPPLSCFGQETTSLSLFLLP